MNPDIQYLFGADIREYDISNAGLSITKAYRLLPKEKIKELELLPKKQLVVRLGLERRDNPDYSKALTCRFADVRRFFIDLNHLDDSNIICVKNDAIFTQVPCAKLKFGDIVFRPKSVYRSYVRFMDKIEVFVGDESTDVKGMNDSVVARHRLYLLDFLEQMVSRIESRDPRAVRHCMRFIEKFKSGELEEPYYLEFNSMSKKADPMQVYTNFIIPLLQISLRECT